jgi:lipoyl(octanoyl) transferase
MENIKPVDIIKTGMIGYDESLKLQFMLHEKRALDKINDTVIIAEHPHVYTMGRRAPDSHFKIPKDKIISMGIEIKEIQRGGEITYHGPGQIVFYIISKIVNRRVKEFVHKIEETSIRFLSDNYNIKAERHPEHRGVWIGDRKITAVGLQIKNNITLHGFAVNINTDLKYYDYIVPCGIFDMGVTSLKEITGYELDTITVSSQIIKHLTEQFGYSA